MGINAEFLKEFNGSATQETTQETTQEIKIEKSVPNRIIELMMMEPNITAKQIAEHLNVSFDGVRYHIKKLRAVGKIKRFFVKCWGGLIFSAHFLYLKFFELTILPGSIYS